MPEALRFSDFLDPVFNDLLLALVLRDGRFLARTRGIIQPWYFSTRVHQVICEATFAYWDAHKSVPPPAALKVAVSHFVPPDATRDAYAAVVDRITALPDHDLPRAFIEHELLRFVQRAEAAAAVGGAFSTLKEFDIDAHAQKMQWVTHLPGIFSSIGINLREHWRRWDDDRDRPRFRTGYPSIDRALRGGGGIRDGELFVFLAPMKRGKSLWLMNMAAALLQMGHRIVHYTLELYEIDVLRRYLSILAKVPTHTLDAHVPTIEAALDALQGYTSGNIVIKEFPAMATTIEMLEGHLSLCEADGYPWIPVIDYADLLAAPHNDEWRAHEQNYMKLRNLGRAHGVPIITASQSNAQGFTAKELGPQHLAGSTRKGFVADYVFAMNQTQDDAEKERFTLTPILNRTSRGDLLSYWSVDYRSGYIDEITKAEYEARVPRAPLQF